MSRVKQLADAEADAIEAVEEADTVDADLEAAVAAEEADRQSDDGLSIEAQERAFEKEIVRHAEAVAELLGDNMAEFEPCEHCATVGYKPRVPYRRDPSLAKCEACDGHGMMITGSLEPSNAVRSCMTCGGQGFITKPLQQPEYQPQPQYQYPPPPPGYEAPRPLDVPVVPPPDGSGWAPGFTPPAAPLPGGR